MDPQLSRHIAKVRNSLEFSSLPLAVQHRFYVEAQNFKSIHDAVQWIEKHRSKS